MKNYNTQKQKDSAREVLKRGKNTEFWKILCEKLEEEIGRAEEQRDDPKLEELEPAAYKHEMRTLTLKKQQFQWLKDLPDYIMEEFGAPEQQEELPDPYDP